MVLEDEGSAPRSLINYAQRCAGADDVTVSGVDCLSHQTGPAAHQAGKSVSFDLNADDFTRMKAIGSNFGPLRACSRPIRSTAHRPTPASRRRKSSITPTDGHSFRCHIRQWLSARRAPDSSKRFVGDLANTSHRPCFLTGFPVRVGKRRELQALSKDDCSSNGAAAQRLIHILRSSVCAAAPPQEKLS